MPKQPYRVAVYYAPERDDPLWTLGSRWLGRDTITGEPCVQPEIPDLPTLTSSPRRYGFHATLKPPMQLVKTFEEFLIDAEKLVRGINPFSLPPLYIDNAHGFTALRPTILSQELNSLAAACVTELDDHRMPEDEETRARRKIGRSESELQNLMRWGYPLVLDDWKFHITLSNAGAGASLLPMAQNWFEKALQVNRVVETLAIFTEASPGADFHLVQRLKLGQ